MKAFVSRAVEPVLGAISLMASWGVWQNILISLFLALAGGFLGYVGKEAAKALFNRKKKNDVED